MKQAGHIVEYGVDHIDRNHFNDQKSNLRLCDKSQNAMNSKIRSDNTSGYRGVHYINGYGKYWAYINCDGKRLNLGYYDTAIEAALAYNNAAIYYHKQFANLNVVE